MLGLSWIANMFPHMDFQGQRLAEQLFQYIILLFGVVGFIWGYICEQFSQTVYILGAGFLLACLLVLPPWGMYRRHNLEWQKPVTASQGKGVTSQKKNK